MKCKHENIDYSIETENFKNVDRFTLITKPITIFAFCSDCEKDLPKHNLFVVSGVYGDFELNINIDTKKDKKVQPVKHGIPAYE
jgi:hypothetical protein